jgi:hypothetical protein
MATTTEPTVVLRAVFLRRYVHQMAGVATKRVPAVVVEMFLGGFAYDEDVSAAVNPHR